MTHQAYKTKDELKLKFKLLNLSFAFVFYDISMLC